MISGAHVVIYSTNPDADRAFLRDVLKFDHVDAGDGWLIFGLPPAEIAIHPGSENDEHEFYLICEDIEALVANLDHLGVKFSQISDEGWGLLSHLQLPGGGKLGVYQPRHKRPNQ